MKMGEETEHLLEGEDLLHVEDVVVPLVDLLHGLAVEGVLFDHIPDAPLLHAAGQFVLLGLEQGLARARPQSQLAAHGLPPFPLALGLDFQLLQLGSGLRCFLAHARTHARPHIHCTQSDGTQSAALEPSLDGEPARTNDPGARSFDHLGDDEGAQVLLSLGW